MSKWNPWAWIKTDFYSGDRELAYDEIRETLYGRLKTVRDRINEPKPDWFNPHDYGSGFLVGKVKACKEEEAFLLDLLNRMERS
jgi:hypothetical protein